MAASPVRASEGPDFPYWPFNCLSIYTQMARDLGEASGEDMSAKSAVRPTRARALH